MFSCNGRSASQILYYLRNSTGIASPSPQPSSSSIRSSRKGCTDNSDNRTVTRIEKGAFTSPCMHVADRSGNCRETLIVIVRSKYFITLAGAEVQCTITNPLVKHEGVQIS